MTDRDPEPWTVLNQETVIDEPPYLGADRQKLALPDGTVVDSFYRLYMPDFAVCLPWTPEGKAVMVRQHPGWRREGLPDATRRTA